MPQYIHLIGSGIPACAGMTSKGNITHSEQFLHRSVFLIPPPPHHAPGRWPAR